MYKFAELVTMAEKYYQLQVRCHPVGFVKILVQHFVFH